jgi:hypothetical protein
MAFWLASQHVGSLAVANDDVKIEIIEDAQRTLAGQAKGGAVFDDLDLKDHTTDLGGSIWARKNFINRIY